MASIGDLANGLIGGAYQVIGAVTPGQTGRNLTETGKNITNPAVNYKGVANYGAAGNFWKGQDGNIYYAYEIKNAHS